MRFGIFTTLYDCAGGARTAADALDNLREQVTLAEALGYDAVWLGEHHFGPYDLGDLPNPILVGADHAARTRRIRIGQMANIAVWWHPIRLAEDLAILDNLTRGRVDVGFGRGVWPYEGPQFHPHADPRKDAENRELFRETVEIVRKAWTEERLAHRGPNYTFPAEDTRFAHPHYPPDPAWQDGDRVLRLRVTPKPYQRPHPPLWMPVSTDRSVALAAELGLGACYWQPPPRRVRQRMERYAEVRSRIEGRAVPPGEAQAVLRNLYVAPTLEAARQEAEDAILSAFIYNDPFRGREVFTNPGEDSRRAPGSTGTSSSPGPSSSVRRTTSPSGSTSSSRSRASSTSSGLSSVTTSTRPSAVLTSSTASAWLRVLSKTMRLTRGGRLLSQ
jgi:alkanesulfonate monooxygenase SsuD/methylene tetrahydromethanopterin reductase-like flavin-dependent oxidoreductase (luciferase family)